MQQQLITWYQENKRPLPWRLECSPYRTLLSEIMCQQTRIDTAIPYYHRFLQLWPTVEDLAKASDDEVVTAWSGLGYYSRARNLHRAAKLVVELGGFPEDVKGLLELPGVGPYTAAAIASIAFGVDAHLVDGNVERVLSRLFGVTEDVRAKEGKNRIWGLAEEILLRGQAGDWNQALMELGAMVCSPRKPGCASCPVSSNCAAHRDSLEESLPFIGRKVRAKPVFATCGVLVRKDKVWMRKRPDEGLLAGMWEFPGTRMLDCQPDKGAFMESWRESFGDAPSGVSRLGSVRHLFSHRKLKLEVFRVESAGAGEGDGTWQEWKSLEELALPKLTEKVWDLAVRQAPT